MDSFADFWLSKVHASDVAKARRDEDINWRHAHHQFDYSDEYTLKIVTVIP